MHSYVGIHATASMLTASMLNSLLMCYHADWGMDSRIRERAVLNSTAGWLNDNIITAAQKLLKIANPDIPGLQEVTWGHCYEFVQVLHTGEGHWVTISTIGSTHPVYNSAYSSVSNLLKMQVASLICTQCPKIIMLFKDNLEFLTVDFMP